ncbi:MAG: hypothetical protein EPO24_02745 [Bacteroidetes bacterium]|nr:MAG: hypothetical protein EPO24_02745 [Bacteroidota bacterium]
MSWHVVTFLIFAVIGMYYIYKSKMNLSEIGKKNISLLRYPHTKENYTTNGWKYRIIGISFLLGGFTISVIAMIVS